MTPETTNELSNHLATGAVVVYLIEWLKRTRLAPWMDNCTVTLNRITSGLLAAVAVIGISYTYDPTVQGGTLVLHGISLATIGAGLWEWAKQYITQQILYDGVIQSKNATTLTGKPSSTGVTL